MGLDEKQVAVIPAGTVINGNIEISGKMEMYGKITGNIKSDDRINLCGEVNGDITANELYAKDSFIEGKIKCKENTVIRENTVVLGDVVATGLVVDGAIQGNIDIRGAVEIGQNAKVDSDIKAKSISVANGAAINGRLDLCYSDVKAKDIFPKVAEIQNPVNHNGNKNQNNHNNHNSSKNQRRNAS